MTSCGLSNKRYSRRTGWESLTYAMKRSCSHLLLTTKLIWTFSCPSERLFAPAPSIEQSS